MSVDAAASVYPPSWYAASQPELPLRAPLRGQARADVAVLGAGYTGLTAALALAEKGYKVTVLEAERVGWGASGRNGGQAIVGYGCEQDTLETLVGDADARLLFDFSREGMHMLKQRIARHGIDCDWRDGHASVPIQPRQERALRNDIERMAQRYDYPLEWWDRPRLQQELASERYLGAVYAGYTVGSVVEPVTLADAGLDSYVRELLGKTAGSTLMTDELWAIEELDLPDTVASLEDLPYFTGLRTISLHHSSASMDLSVLAQLPTLRTLDLSGCTLSSAAMSTIVSLPELTSLNLSGCAVIDINALIGLQKLEFLDLSNNTISDLTALSALQALKELHLTNNPITSLANLKNCTQLEILYANQCSITRIAGLADHTALKELYLANNQIADISIVSELRQLVDLNVSNNQITVFPAVDADTPLWHVDISHNQIEDLTGLAGNLSVNFINADYNKIKSIAKLEACVMLVKMNLWDNPVNTDEVKKLQDVGIIINYNPEYKEADTEA